MSSIVWCQQRQARWLESQAVARYVSSDVVGYEDLADRVSGNSCPTTATSGSRQRWPTIGRRTALVIGPGSCRGDGPGSMTHPGDSHRSTTADGATSAGAGDGYRRHRIGMRSTPPRSWPGSAARARPRSAAAAAVGWLPLAPGEVYVPSYRASARYLQNVNLSNSSSSERCRGHHGAR